MPLEWTHEKCRKPACDGTTKCSGFPTVEDRVRMAQAAYQEYAESDGTSVIDFALDVLLFTQSQSAADETLLSRLARQARREWAKKARARQTQSTQRKEITYMKHLFILTVLAVISFTNAHAQDTKAHWGIQGDVGKVSFPKFAIEKIDALPERPDVAGTTYSIGLVRFHANGAPSYALQFSKLDANFSGAQQQGPFRRELAGSGTVRGFMATKYVNVVAKKHVSGGFAFGGGIGKLEASYVRSTAFVGIPQSLEANSYDRVVPLFEILGRIDVRPVKYISVGPYYGIRNGTLAAGVAVRIHFVK